MILPTGKLTEDDMKKIVHDIVEEEIKNTGVSVGINALTFVEYVKSDKFKKQSSLQKIIKYFYTRGIMFHEQRELAVFIDHNLLFQSLNNNFFLVDLIKTTYHEFRHNLQREAMEDEDKNNALSFNSLIYNMEGVIRSRMPLDYEINHNKYLKEIDANIYGIQKTEELFKKNPTFYEENKFYIDSLIRKFNNIIKRHHTDFEFKDSWLEIFYNENGVLKSIDEILENKDLYTLNQKFQYLVMSSREMIERTDFSTLSNKGREFLNNALSYSYDLAIERRNNNRKALQNSTLGVGEWLENDCSIVDSIVYFGNTISLLGKNLINTVKPTSLNFYENNLSELNQDLDNKRR